MEDTYKTCKSCGTQNSISEAFCVECFQADFLIKKSETEQNTIIDAGKNQLELSNDHIKILLFHNDIVGRNHSGLEELRNYKKVSRSHAKFYFNDNIWYIEDLDSTNGTFVKGIKISSYQKVELNEGDMIKLSSDVILKVTFF